MDISKDCQIWKLCNRDRGSLGGVYFDAAAGELRATDGRAAIILKVNRQEENEESGLIPLEAFKEAAKLAKRGADIFIHVKEGKAHLADGRTFPLLLQTFPTLAAVIPNTAQWGPQRARIALNPALLATLAEAAGMGETAGLTLEFSLDDDNAARRAPVMVYVGRARVAVIMPMGNTDNRLGKEGAHAAALQEEAAKVSA